jgi:hypothetical protein
VSRAVKKISSDATGGQAAVAATAHGIDFVVHFSGLETIVHRHVTCPRTGRYYLEASQRIPIDSSDAPPLAIVTAIVLTARHVLPEPPTLPDAQAPMPSNVDATATLRPPYITARCRRYGRSFTSAPIVHFDVEGLNRGVTFVVNVLATPSSPCESLPTLSGTYWRRALSSSEPEDDNEPAEDSFFWDWPFSVPFWPVRLGGDDEDENAPDITELWEQSWDSWRRVRREFSPRTTDLLLSPAASDPSLTPAEFERQRRAIVAAPSTIKFTEFVAEEGATGMALRGHWYGATIGKHAAPTRSQALLREALFYKDHFAHLRGVIVPEFLGLYRSDFWALLVLKDAGSDIPVEWEELPEQDR